MTPPVTPIRARSAWEPLENALRHRRPVRLAYHGRQRVVCPHALGWKNGRPMLLAYQTTPPADTADSRPGWRCMYIDEIDNVDTADPAAMWVTARDYNPARPFPAIDHVTIAI
jgi:predicted DNA-binding transcriptional regulator YafY